jgi:hypothetical protein
LPGPTFLQEHDLNKLVPLFAVTAILLSGCAASSGNHTAGADPAADRTLPTGTYLKRRPGKPQDAETVDKTQLENMQRTGAGTINI